jgi:hypothetical protein
VQNAKRARSSSHYRGSSHWIAIGPRQLESGQYNVDGIYDLLFFGDAALLRPGWFLAHFDEMDSFR